MQYSVLKKYQLFKKVRKELKEMKNKPLTKFKFENVVFIVLVVCSLVNATTITNNGLFGVFSGLYTLIVQTILWYGLKMILANIRKNPQTVATEIASLFKD